MKLDLYEAFLIEARCSKEMSHLMASYAEPFWVAALHDLGVRDASIRTKIEEDNARSYVRHWLPWTLSCIHRDIIKIEKSIHHEKMRDLDEQVKLLMFVC